MAVTLRSAITNRGPRSGSSWVNPLGENIFVQAPGSMGNTVSVESVLLQVPQASTYSTAGTIFDVVNADNVIGNLTGAWLTPSSAAMPTYTSYVTELRVYRAGALVGATNKQWFAGWAAVPATAQFTPVFMPFNATGGNAYVALVAPYNQTLTTTVACLPLQTGDVITLFVSNGTGGTITTYPAVNILLEIA